MSDRPNPPGPKPIVFGDSRDGGEKFRPRPIVLPSETMTDDKKPREINLAPAKDPEKKPREINLASPPPPPPAAPERRPRAANIVSPPSPPYGGSAVRNPNDAVTWPIGHETRTPRAADIKPSPPAPPQATHSGRAPKAMGEDPRLQAFVERAEALQPAIASEIRFKARLNKFLGLRPIEWVSFGNEVLSTVSTAADAQASLTVIVQQANIAHWCDQVNAAFNAPTKPRSRGAGVSFGTDDGYIPSMLDRIGGMFDRSPKYESPAYYETKLNVGKNLLTDALTKCMQAEEALREKIHTLAIDSLIFQLLKEKTTDPGNLSLLDSKHRTFLQAQQTALMQLQSFETFEGTIQKHIANVDQLLFNLIPQWKMSVAQQRP